MSNPEMQQPDGFEIALQAIDQALAQANERQDKVESARLVQEKDRILKLRAEKFGEKIEPQNTWE